MLGRQWMAAVVPLGVGLGTVVRIGSGACGSGGPGMSNRHLDDAELVEVLQGELRVVSLALEDASPESLDLLRRGEWSIRLTVEGLQVEARRRDATSAAGELLADETEAFLREGRNGENNDH